VKLAYTHICLVKERLNLVPGDLVRIKNFKFLRLRFHPIEYFSDLNRTVFDSILVESDSTIVFLGDRVCEIHHSRNHEIILLSKWLVKDRVLYACIQDEKVLNFLEKNDY